MYIYSYFAEQKIIWSYHYGEFVGAEHQDAGIEAIRRLGRSNSKTLEFWVADYRHITSATLRDSDRAKFEHTLHRFRELGFEPLSAKGHYILDEDPPESVRRRLDVVIDERRINTSIVTTDMPDLMKRVGMSEDFGRAYENDTVRAMETGMVLLRSE